MSSRVLALLPCLLVAGLAGAEPPPAPADPQPDIVVQGRTEEAVRRFLDAAVPTRTNGQIARWDERICVKVVNIAPDQARFVENAIEQTARSFKISVDPSPKCGGNISVIFTDDSDKFTDALLTRYSRNYQDATNQFLSSRQIKEALRPRAVRWLETDYTSDTTYSGRPSHILARTHRAFGYSLIIVDIKRLNGLSWGQLAAYLAAVALVNPRLGASYAGQDSILSLFDRDPKQAPTDLTAQDRALIAGLYASEARQPDWKQRTDIRRALKRAATEDKPE